MSQARITDRVAPVRRPLLLLALLNDHAPAQSDLTTGVTSQRAKTFPLYIYLDDVCRNLAVVFNEQ